MMNWIVKSSLKFRYIVLATAIAMMYFGYGQIKNMPVDVFPEFAPPLVNVQTPAIGLSAEEVESLVTVPLEESLTGIPDLDIMRSKSVPQLSEIQLIFDRGTSLLDARQLVQERLDQITPSLPAFVAPPAILQPLSSTSRMLKIGMTSKEMSLIDLSMTAEYVVRPKLMNIPGVANVAIWGQRKDIVFVKFDPERLQVAGVTLDSVLEASADATDAGLLKYSTGAVVGTGGWVENNTHRIGIRHKAPLVSPESVGQITFGNKFGEQVRLDQVTDVVQDHQLMVGDGVINDEIGILLIVEKFPWGNTLAVSRAIEKELETLKPALKGIEVDPRIFRPATYIETSIGNLSNAMLMGAALVIIILILFLFEWRVALISVVAIPLSLMAAALVLSYTGAAINVMILAGFVIALGAVVDDAIIDVENIMRRLRQNKQEGKEESIASTILNASLEIRSAIIYATLIEVAALIPVFFMESLSGTFFIPLATSYALAILASMLVALTVTPALAVILLRKAPLEHKGSPLVHVLRSAYQRALVPIISRPIVSYGTIGVILISGALILPRMGQELLPSFKERDFLMHWLAKPGTSWPEMNRITIQAAKELQEIPGIQNFGAHIGQAVHMDEVVGMYFGENWVSVDPKADYDTALDAIQEAVDGYPGLYRDVQTYLKERIREVLTGSSDAIVVRTFGEDLDVLRAKAEEIYAKLEGIEGIVDLHIELITEVPQIEVQVDLTKARAYGLKPGDIRRAASAMMGSVEVSDLYHQGRIYDIRVMGTPEKRGNIYQLKTMLIDTPDGGHVQLQDIADVNIVPAPNVLKRENVARRLDVEANVKGRDLGSVYRDVEHALDSIRFPKGFHAELLGEYTERLAATNRLQLWSVGAIILILGLLQTSYGAWRLTFISFVTLPIALVGGLIAAWMTSGMISLGSLVGFLTVLGIAARNGIMMINHFQHLEREEGETLNSTLVLRGARERLAPILMTATTTGVALLPLVIAGNLPGHEIEHPMAVVILGGLVTSTFMNLFVVPSLYLRFAKRADTIHPQLTQNKTMDATLV